MASADGLSGSGTEQEELIVPRSEYLLIETQKSCSEAMCIKCKMPVDPFRAIIKSKSSQQARARYVCRTCNAATTMLTRSMVWPPQMFSELDDEQQASFWRATKETSSPDSRFSYSKIRALLIKTLVSKKIVEDSTEVWSEAKPLSVWEKMGYDIDAIRSKGKAETCAILGDVYSFSQKRTSSKVTVQMIEEHLKKAEQAVHQVKRPDAADDEEALLSDSSEEQPAKKQKNTGGSSSKGKKPLTEKQVQAQESKAEKLREKKSEMKRLKDNAACHAFANRVISAVSSPMAECFMALEAVKESAEGTYPAATLKLLNDSFQSLKEFKEQATAVARQQLKKADGHLELDFNQPEFQSKITEAKQALKSFNDLTKILNR